MTERFNHQWSSYQEACKMYDVEQKDYPRYTDQNHEKHEGYFICNSGNEWICLPCGTKLLTEKGRKQIEMDKKEDEDKLQDRQKVIDKEINAMNENERSLYYNVISEHRLNHQTHDYYMSCCFNEEKVGKIKSKAGTTEHIFSPIYHRRSIIWR